MQRAPLEVKPPEDEWVYFYSTRQTAVSGCLPRDDGRRQSASNSVEVRAEEAAAAAQGLKSLARRLGTLAVESTPALDLAAEIPGFLALLRQGLEQELVQLRIFDGGAHPPKQMVRAACRRQCDVLMVTHRIGLAARAAGSEAAVGQWAFDAAWASLVPHVLGELDYDGMIDWDTMEYEPVSARAMRDPQGCLLEAIRDVVGEETAAELSQAMQR